MSILDRLVLFLPTLGFFVLGTVILVSAWMVGQVRRITHAAFFMVLAFTGVAGVFVLLGADFLAGSQVLVYVGAIAVMFLFAIMVSDLKELSGPAAGSGPGGSGSRAPEGDGEAAAARTAARAWVLLAGLVAVAFAGIVLAAVAKAGLPEVSVPAASGEPTTVLIGRELFTKFLVPFEVASVVLLAALVGAIVLAAREDKDRGLGEEADSGAGAAGRRNGGVTA
ncbi:MAG TPA: hypothetical protein DHW14_05295 [Clostridiales bacterium]|nr:hypothetical protein [Clostridiales bacterium]